VIRIFDVIIGENVLVSMLHKTIYKETSTGSLLQERQLVEINRGQKKRKAKRSELRDKKLAV